jgi:hypothetical protein
MILQSFDYISGGCLNDGQGGDGADEGEHIDMGSLVEQSLSQERVSKIYS